MKEIKAILERDFPLGRMDAVAVGRIEFKTGKFEVVEAEVNQHGLDFSGKTHYFFDLASLTKPLSNSLAYFLKPELFDANMLLALSHRGGIPAWGLLSKDDWEKQILSYSIKESPTLYSDFSALRVLLEFNKKDNLKKVCSEVWDKEVLNWLDLHREAPVLQYGFINQEPNLGHVHDPNALNLGTFCTHAGLFGTIQGLCKTLLNYQKQTDFINKVKIDLASHKNRFSFGWDRVENFENPLAGLGCGPSTFGHLGFTGTSIWIDPDRNLGQVILTNATKNYWFDKEDLNIIRRSVGESIWS